MANHKSAAKRARQTLTKTARNSRVKATVRTFEKKILSAVANNNSEEAQSLFKTYTSKIAKAAQKGILHANLAARKTSRLANRINTLSK